MTEPTVSVVIASYTEDRWPQLVAAVESVFEQTRPADEVIIGVDHNAALLRRIEAELPKVRVVENTQLRGASGARNSAAAAATGDVLAFFDDDAIAATTWLANLVGHLSDPRVVGVGGRTDPIWAGGTPKWLPEEFLWIVGSHYRGMPEQTAPVRNVWSANMAVRRHEFNEVGGFLSGFGKIGNVSRPEDTEFCLRIAHTTPGSHWLYVVDAVTWHQLPPDRRTFRFFARRCYAEGRGKAELDRIDRSGQALRTERDYVTRVLPRGVVRGVADTARGTDRFGLVKSGAIAAGTALSVAGLVTQRAESAMRARR